MKYNHLDIIEVLLFSTGFVISVLFGDVKTVKNRLILCHRQLNIAIIDIFRAQNSSAFCCQKEEYVLPLFHKMLEGL